MLQPYPGQDQFAVDETAESDIEWIKSFVLGIRQIRGEMDISPGKPLNILLQDAADQDSGNLEQHGILIRKLARIEDIRLLQPNEEPPTSATALLGGMKILVPMAGLIDVAAEKARLDKQRSRAVADLQKIEAKLANDSFVNKAPAAVVEKERGRQQDLQQEIEQLDKQTARLEELG